MNIRNSYGLIHIGLLLRYLQNLNQQYHSIKVLEYVDDLKKELQEAGLQVSLSAINSLNVLIDALERIKQLNSTTPIGQECNILNEEMKVIESIVFSEALTKNIYEIPERRYNGNYLLNEPLKLLQADVFGKLTDIAKFDFMAACRCLCFGEGTASAFHILRATEDTLKEYYFHFKKTKRLAKPMWGPMTIELRNKRAPKPKESILNALDVVRTTYRNPTQHPQITYDIDSAQDLFGVCVDLINKMSISL